MKRINIDHIILHLIFFASGIYILMRIFIPILNPASLATGSNYDGQNFYKQILKQANGAIDITSSEISNTKNSNELLSVLFTYLTGIDLSNPKTYISSVLPVLQFIDITNIESKDENPNLGSIVVIPREDKSPIVENKTSTGANKPRTNTPKSSSNLNQNSGILSKANPTEVSVNKQKLDNNKPLVLIFHSHTTEAYNPNQIKDKNFSPDNLNLTVSKVGDMLDYELEDKYGISTIHNSTIHDLPTRLGAYTKARPTVQYYLKKYPSLKLIIDLHRDGDVKRSVETAIINKEKYARVMFVAGTQFKNSKTYNKTTQNLYNEFEYLYPNFARKTDYKSSKNTYNQDLSSKMVLIEVGSDENSLDEALNSTSIIAKVIAKYLK
jgi:stage II sporulation protein P